MNPEPVESVSPQETLDAIADAAIRFAQRFKEAGIDPGPALDRIVETARLVLLSTAKRDRRTQRRGGRA